MTSFLHSSRSARVWISSLAAFALLGAAPVRQLGAEKPPTCGEEYAPPFAAAAGPRTCPATTDRVYTRRYRGIAYEALDLETEACFVPDASYALLDQIIGDSLQRASAAAIPGETNGSRALKVSAIVGTVLEERGFGLHIPTDTIGDALTNRARGGERPRHTIDCDISSLILLTVAENLRLPAQLVEITLASGSGHNYVRWQLSPTEFLDWDTNGRGPCETPSNLPPFEGRGMTRDETISYLLAIRGALMKRRGLFERSAEDYQGAIAMAPNRPFAMNNYAWMIATRTFPGRDRHKAAALTAARRAVELHRIPGYLDTLACTLALNSEFETAAAMQEEALGAEPNNADYRRRLALFRTSPPRDCTGED